MPPFGGLWYTTPDDAIDYAKHNSRAHDAVIHVYDDVGSVIETHEHKGEFKESLFGVKLDWNSAQPCTVNGCLID